MDSNELRVEMSMNYDELVEYLLNKYGKAQYDYFCSEKCRSKNHKAIRTAEGLFCHHIDENVYVDLSNPEFAVLFPFSSQKADKLVYCNYLEHLLLHIRIGKDQYWRKNTTVQSPECLLQFLASGIVYICHMLNRLYEENGSALEWQMRCYNEIEDNFEDYIFVLKCFFSYLQDSYEGKEKLKCRTEIQNIKKFLAKDWDERLVKKTWKAIK